MPAPVGTPSFTGKVAKRLDKFTKKASRNVFVRLSLRYPDLVYRKKLESHEIPGGIGSCEPDGGIWFYHDKIIVSIEGKSQGLLGNAGQRWYQNIDILRTFTSNMTYITFGAGESAELVYTNEKGHVKKDGTPYHVGLMWDMHFAHCEGRGVINEMKLGVNNYYPRIEGFTLEEMESIMEKTIIAAIEAAEA